MTVPFSSLIPVIYSVSSAIVQRYIEHILTAALSTNTQIQASAVDILSFTVKQGLAHPVQVSLSSLGVGSSSLTGSLQ